MAEVPGSLGTKEFSMHRREFFRKGLGVALGGVSVPAIPRLFGEPGKESFSSPDPVPELVAVHGGSPSALFDAGIRALGGMKAFVRKGQTVVVKPNIGWNAGPERASNTNPELVGRIVEHCFEAGARKVHVLDHTCDPWRKCYRNSGIQDAARKAGAIMVTGNDNTHYGKVEIPEAEVLTTAEVHELVAECDVLLNVPVLKNHGGAVVSLAMKNLMGVVWDRRYWHRNDLHQCIADFPTFRRPDLNIIDGYRALLRNGPQGVSVKDTALMKKMVLSRDIVAADTAATLLQGKQARDVPFIGHARRHGLGESDLSKLRIRRIRL